MRDPIVRMYETEQQARDAVQKLQAEGFPEDQIFLVTPQSGGTVEAIAAAIMAGFVLRSHAKVYAEGIQKGRSLVVVRASFGHSQDAIDILNSFVKAAEYRHIRVVVKGDHSLKSAPLVNAPLTRARAT